MIIINHNTKTKEQGQVMAVGWGEAGWLNWGGGARSSGQAGVRNQLK